MFRQKTGCRQYPFESIEEAEKFCARRPYAEEQLRFMIAINAKPHTELHVSHGRSAGEALRAWFDQAFPAGLAH